MLSGRTVCQWGRSGLLCVLRCGWVHGTILWSRWVAGGKDFKMWENNFQKCGEILGPVNRVAGKKGAAVPAGRTVGIAPLGWKQTVVGSTLSAAPAENRTAGVGLAQLAVEMAAEPHMGHRRTVTETGQTGRPAERATPIGAVIAENLNPSTPNSGTYTPKAELKIKYCENFHLPWRQEKQTYNTVFSFSWNDSGMSTLYWEMGGG